MLKLGGPNGSAFNVWHVEHTNGHRAGLKVTTYILNYATVSNQYHKYQVGNLTYFRDPGLAKLVLKETKFAQRRTSNSGQHALRSILSGDNGGEILTDRKTNEQLRSEMCNLPDYLDPEGKACALANQAKSGGKMAVFTLQERYDFFE